MTDVKPGWQEAQKANHLVNTAGAFGPLIALARELPPAVLSQLRLAHQDAAVDLCCSAHCEGQQCCIDILLDDPAMYDPGKITAAEELLHQYRQSLP